MADEKKLENLDMTNDISDEAFDVVSDVDMDETELTEKQKRARLIKTASLLIFSFIILVVAAIAWFSMTSEIMSTGMLVKAKPDNFELKSSGSTGLYDNYITRVDDGYTTGTQTGPSTSQIILRLTNDSQVENLWVGENPPTSADLDRIKRIESTEYGLSPGDHGSIKFSIVPRDNLTGGINVLIKPEISCYKTDYYTAEDTGHIPGYQKDVIDPMDPDDDDEGLAIGFTSSHISLYYKADEDDDGTEELHLITDEGFLVENITSEREVTIYWVWPEELSEILEADVQGSDESASIELRKAFFAAPDDYLEKINETDDFSDLVIPASDSESAREAKAQEVLESLSEYNFYSNRYNNADQTIGDMVGYILLEVNAEE